MSTFDRGTNEKPLRTVVVGYGLAGSVFHAPLIASTPGMTVSALVTRDPERRSRAAADFPEARVLIDMREVRAEASMYDLLVVATPNRFHAAIAREAFDLGLAVVVDKPMARSTAEVAGLIEAARLAGTALTCFQNRRWDGDFLTVRRLIQEDAFGGVARFESRFDRYRPEPRAGAWRERGDPDEAGGLLWDLGSHLIDQALVLFGLPRLVYAEMPTRRPGSETDDDTFVALEFPNGTTAHLWMSMVSRIQAPRFRVTGLRGAFEKYGLDPQEAALRQGMRPSDPGWGEDSSELWGHLVTSQAGEEIDRRVTTEAGSYQSFYAGVRDALTEGTPMPVDPADVLTTTAIIEAAQQSAVNKQTVEFQGRRTG